MTKTGKLAVGGAVIGGIVLLAMGAKKIDVIPADPNKPEPPPKPPDPKKCNYVGCTAAPGYKWPAWWPANLRNPIGVAIEIQKLGYPGLNPAAPGWSIISGQSMAVIRQFQRDYNEARKRQSVEPVPSSLATDGLVGNKTLAAVLKAQNWVNMMNIPFEDIVALEEI